MKKLKGLYSIIIMIAIPVLVVLIALNITLRSPEVYSYCFNDSQALDYTTLSLSSNELSDQLADFSWGLFSEDIDITENAGYMDDPIFDDTEAEVLFEIRDILTKSFCLMLIILAIIIVLYFYFIKKSYKEELFTSCKIGAVISVVFLIISTIVISSNRIIGKIYDTFVGIDLGKDSLLKLLFTKGDFNGAVSIAQLGFGIIALILICYITWRLTKPPRIYKRR